MCTARFSIAFAVTLVAPFAHAQVVLHEIQVHYRDPSGPCGSGFNLTNAWELVFQP